MKRIKLRADTLGDIDKFFSLNNIGINNAPINKNESIDGTGQNPSVQKAEADRIAKYILNKFECDNIKVIDVGTGLGYMVEAYLNNNINGYGIEGFVPLAKKCAAGKDRVSARDMSIKIEDDDAFKCANLTTSFEVFEHVHRKHEDVFIRNLAYLSDYHLCSIHMFKWPGVNENHCNIKHECCWFELFRKHNIKFDIIGRRTGQKNPIAREYRGTPGSCPTTAIGGSEEFREQTDTYHWEESMFCILDMREYKF